MQVAECARMGGLPPRLRRLSDVHCLSSLRGAVDHHPTTGDASLLLVTNECTGLLAFWFEE